MLYQEDEVKASKDSCFKSVDFSDDTFCKGEMIAFAEYYANQRVIEELERLKSSASGTPEHRVVWEWDLDDRIKELKQ